MRLTITLVTLTALALGVAASAHAWQRCFTNCRYNYDGSQSCSTQCFD